MDRLQYIYEVIAKEGFSDLALQEIDNYTKDIQNGTEDFSRFNLSEHAGLCKGGAHLIGASIVACYATASITAGSDVESSQGSPANWEIDEKQEQLIESRRAFLTTIREYFARVKMFIDIFYRKPCERLEG